MVDKSNRDHTLVICQLKKRYNGLDRRIELISGATITLTESESNRVMEHLGNHNTDIGLGEQEYSRVQVVVDGEEKHLITTYLTLTHIKEEVTQILIKHEQSYN